MQGAGALLGQAEMLLAQSLERLMLSDLHTRAHVAVAVHEEGESAGQVFAAWRVKDKRGMGRGGWGGGRVREMRLRSLSYPHNHIESTPATQRRR